MVTKGTTSHREEKFPLPSPRLCFLSVPLVVKLIKSFQGNESGLSPLSQSRAPKSVFEVERLGLA
jgi:hypothetical protein